MTLSGNIRVRTDRHHKTLYNQLRNFAVKDMHETFFLCTCLGYRAEERKPLGHNGEPRFWSSTFTPDEYASFYAMAIELADRDFGAISDDQGVIGIMEEYANAGMDILLREVLSDYILTNSGEVCLDPANSSELPKVLLAFIREQVDS